MICALRAWGETWRKEKDEEVAMHFVHRECGHDVELANICPHCERPIDRKDLDASMGKNFATERAARQASFKRK